MTSLHMTLHRELSYDSELILPHVFVSLPPPQLTPHSYCCHPLLLYLHHTFTPTLYWKEAGLSLPLCLLSWKRVLEICGVVHVCLPIHNSVVSFVILLCPGLIKKCGRWVFQCLCQSVSSWCPWPDRDPQIENLWYLLPPVLASLCCIPSSHHSTVSVRATPGDKISSRFLKYYLVWRTI